MNRILELSNLIMKSFKIPFESQEIGIKIVSKIVLFILLQLLI